MKPLSARARSIEYQYCLARTDRIALLRNGVSAQRRRCFEVCRNWEKISPKGTLAVKTKAKVIVD